MYVLSVWRILKQCAPVCRTKQYSFIYMLLHLKVGYCHCSQVNEVLGVIACILDHHHSFFHTVLRVQRKIHEASLVTPLTGAYSIFPPPVNAQRVLRSSSHVLRSHAHCRNVPLLSNDTICACQWTLAFGVWRRRYWPWYYQCKNYLVPSHA